MYTININPDPEVFNNKPMYFWMIEGKTEYGIEHNYGHGWSGSVAQAAIDANEYYRKTIKEVDRAAENSENVITHGSIVYWARRYGRVVCKCEVITINETDNRVVSFVVKMLDDNYALGTELHLKGSALGDVVFIDEEKAKKRLEEFDKESEEE